MALLERLLPSVAGGILLSAVLLMAAPAGAHHSFSMFDGQKEMLFDGTVAQFQWSNPHVFIDLYVQTKTGVQRYSFEGPGPGMLKPSGWKRTSIKPGDRVKIAAYPLRDGRPGGMVIEVILPDGKKLDAMGRGFVK